MTSEISIIVAQQRTGRGWGDKRAARQGKAVIGAVRVEWEEFDHWDGPVEAVETGEFIRATRITKLGPIEWPK